MGKTALDLMSSEARGFALKRHGHFIGGEWIQRSDAPRIEVMEPASGLLLTEVDHAERSEVDAAVSSARTAFVSGKWPKTSPSLRAKLLWRLAELIDEHADVIAELESLDNGKPKRIARLADVALAAEHFRYYAGWAGKDLGQIVQPFSSTMRTRHIHAYVEREPVGVVAQIIPWNFPLLIAAWKLAPALAVGCTVVLKPAEQTPITAMYLSGLIREAGFPAGVVNVLNGDGRTGALLASHGDVDKVSFTGSTEVGKSVLAAAGGNLKRVSLELGGKSPNLIFADADVDKAIIGAASAIFFNHGQCCTAGSRLLIAEEIFERVIMGIKAYAQKIKVGIGMDPETEMGPLVSKEQQMRVNSYIQAGMREGAELICGGPSTDGQGYFVPPTVLINTARDMSMVREEIFGPVVCATPFRSEEEAIVEANDSIYGLAAGIWTGDVTRAHRVSKALRAGLIWVNCYNLFDAALPFGGFKQSGWGREMGQEALALYTETKAVCIDLGKH